MDEPGRRSETERRGARDARARRADHREPPAGHPRSGRDARVLRPLPPLRGAPDHRGLPGRGKDDARQGARALGRLLVLPPPVHARPASLGRHRRERLQPALERVRVPARAGLRERPPRRRDQPRLAEDPGRAPRVHAGAAGDGRRRLLPARAAVHGHGDAEPDRVRGHVPAARGRARPLHDADRDRLPAARRRGEDADREREPRRRSTRSSPSPAPRRCSARSRTPSSVYVEESLNRYVVAVLRHTRTDNRLYLGASPRAGIALLRVAKARALVAGRDYVQPDDVKAVAPTVLAHRLILAPEARSAGLDAEELVRDVIEQTPVPV